MSPAEVMRMPGHDFSVKNVVTFLFRKKLAFLFSLLFTLTLRLLLNQERASHVPRKNEMPVATSVLV